MTKWDIPKDDLFTMIQRETVLEGRHRLGYIINEVKFHTMVFIVFFFFLMRELEHVSMLGSNVTKT